MASLFAGSDSDDDSDFDDDATIASNETGGDSYFDELSLASEDDLDIYGQGTGRDRVADRITYRVVNQVAERVADRVVDQVAGLMYQVLSKIPT